MSGKNKEKIMRTAADVREEMEAWRKKLQHAEERRCELLARWHSIDEMKRGLLAEFVERIEDDIIWMGNEIALCECELLGREDYPSVACGDSSPDKGSQGEHEPCTRDTKADQED